MRAERNPEAKTPGAREGDGVGVGEGDGDGQ